MPNPTPGTILGAYRIEGLLGAGSMGEVYRAIDTGLNRRVAIKILSEKHRDSQELRQRFVREGRAVAAISHPNVVQVFATGTFDDRPYIAMELLEGIDLGTTVEKNGPLTSTEATHAMLDAAQGLAAASKAGLIHRDVKPSNLVRLTDGRVKVTDFGLAKPVDPGSEPALTAMGVVVGTPDYIAPEQARGEPIDERVDIYALGGTLYFLLTGMPPFRTGKPAEDKYLKVVARHLRNPPPEAAVTSPSTDRELSDLARQMMAKKPLERPSYAEAIQIGSEILGRLDPGAVPQLLSSRERSRPIVIPSEAGGASLAEGDFDVPRRGIPVWLVMLTLACIGVFVAGLVVYLTRGGPETAAPVDVKPTTVPAPIVPAGMLLVKRPNGTPWFFVDQKLVSANALHDLFEDHVQAGDNPVVMVSYDEARSYAKSKRGRLLKSEEWDAAAQVPGFVVSDGIYEWVESPEGKRMVRGLMRSEPANAGERGQTKTPSQIRPDKDQKDVSFRIAKDI